MTEKEISKFETSEIKLKEIQINKMVKVRKYDVNVEKLKETLKKHKIMLNWSIGSISEYIKRPKTEVEHWFRTDNCFSIPSADIWFELKDLLNIDTDEFDKSITEFIEKPNAFESGNRAYEENGLSPTVTATTSPNLSQNYRIRKLTPKECWRLMGVKDEDYDNVAKNQSNSSLYHLAGDSIVTTCLMGLFGEMLGIDYDDKINKLQTDIKGETK